MNFVDLWGLEAGDRNVSKYIDIYIYRDLRSYDISTDRDNPKNTYLDKMMVYNNLTGQYVILNKVQTVANYPSTDAKGNPVESCYLDTIAPGSVDIVFYTTTNVASGTAATLANAKTLDGRNVDKNGYTENPKSEGRGLVHSNRGQNNQNDYKNPYSKQCIIMSYENNKLFFDTLKNWNVKNNDKITAKIFDVEEIIEE